MTQRNEFWLMIGFVIGAGIMWLCWTVSTVKPNSIQYQERFCRERYSK